jgi:serine/threonine protein kinase
MEKVSPDKLTKVNVKLCDFSNATLSTIWQNIQGTPGYTAPEQASDIQYDSCKSDMWSVGATLAILIASLPPDYWMHVYSYWPSHMELFQRFIIETVEYSREKLYGGKRVSNLHDLVWCKLMSTDPDARPSARETLEHPWFQK